MRITVKVPCRGFESVSAHCRLGLALVAALFLLGGMGTACAADKQVTVITTPNDGIQPQAIVDAKGVLHLLYFKGKASDGDLFYVRREPGKRQFSEPIQVNSTAGSAIAIGSIRGGQLALGKDGRVHVAWNSPLRDTPKGPGAQMVYARLNDAGTAFEKQRNLMQSTFALDGGGAVTADQDGNVFVSWHGLQFDAERGEGNRQVWIAISTDEGKTFAPEKQANVKPTGACGCCGMKAFTDSKGTLSFLYRSAAEKVHRDIYLLTSKDHGKSFEETLLHKWNIDACPMSSEAFAEGPNGVVAAWETDGQIYFTKIAKGEAGTPEAVPGAGKGRKHPATAINAKGEMILVWAEGTGWQKGGALAWQVYDIAGKPTAEKGRLENGVPVWGLPAVVANTDGGFLIIH